MFNTIMQKLIAAALALSTVLAGVSMVPALAQAQSNNGLHLGVTLNAQTAPVKIQNDDNIGIGLGNLGVNLMGTTSPSNGNSVKNVVNPAKIAFQQAVKSANTTYKTSKATAKAQLRA